MSAEMKAALAELTAIADRAEARERGVKLEAPHTFPLSPWTIGGRPFQTKGDLVLCSVCAEWTDSADPCCSGAA